MYKQWRMKELRHAYSVQGWAMLIYYGILNGAVMIVMMVDAFVQAFAMAASGKELDVDALTNSLIASSGWGYFIAIAVGLFVLLLWKKPRYLADPIWKKGEPMKIRSFFGILAILLSAQLVAQGLYWLLELMFNLGGFSIAQAMESAGGSMDSLSMFLYVGLGAPISEELLFRGLVLRSMEPYGKKFAILASALMFGLYHGNIIQIPFAFLVGLVLAYVTVEYNIGWAILLHLINNLILSDTLVRLISYLSQPWPDLIFWGLIVGCAVAALIILLVKRKRIQGWFRRYQDDPLCAKAFWGAPGIITLVSVIGAMTLISTLMMITPLGG